MNKKQEFRDNILYGVHTGWVWWAGLSQVIHTYTTQSVEDIKIWMPIGFLIANLISLPRCFHSPYRIWGICHIGSAVILSILLIGVVMYG